jgi:hypothetical protein
MLTEVTPSKKPIDRMMQRIGCPVGAHHIGNAFVDLTPTIAVDRSFRCKFANAAAVKVLGYPSGVVGEDIVGEDLSVHVPADIRDAHLEWVWDFFECAQPGMMVERFVTLVRHDQSETHVQVFLMPFTVFGTLYMAGLFLSPSAAAMTDDGSQ